MAYSRLTPPSLISARIGTQSGAIWSYSSADALGTVAAINYVNNAYELGMRAGDMVLHVDTTNSVSNMLTVQTGATIGTAVGATTDTAGYAAGVSTVTLASAGTGTIVVGDVIRFGNDPDSEYVVTTGDADVSGGGSVVFTPVLVTAIGATATPIKVQSNVLNLSPQSTGGGEVLIAAKTLVAGDSGKTFYLNLAGGFATTLPAPSMGLKFKFVVNTAPTTAYTVVTASSANVIHGQVSSAEDAAGSVACAASSDTISFVANKAIKGDWVSVESDGTSWFVQGMCNVQDGITTTQAS